MIFGRLLAVLIATTALASCAVAAVVALTYAFWALLAPMLGGPSAAAAVALAAAILVAVAAAVAAFAIAPRSRAGDALAPSLDAALDFVQARPVVSVVAGAGGLLLAALQPRLAAAAASNFIKRRRAAQQ